MSFQSISILMFIGTFVWNPLVTANKENVQVIGVPTNDHMQANKGNFGGLNGANFGKSFKGSFADYSIGQNDPFVFGAGQNLSPQQLSPQSSMDSQGSFVDGNYVAGVHTSVMGTNIEGDYETSNFRAAALRSPDIWKGDDADWKCGQNTKCQNWERIYLAIKRYIKFDDIVTKATESVSVKMSHLAVRPHFRANLSGGGQNNSHTESAASALNQQHQEKELVYVMIMTELALKIRQENHEIEYEPMIMLNKQLVEDVLGWAAFCRDGIGIKSGQPIKRYYVFEDGTIVKTEKDYKREVIYAENTLRMVLGSAELLKGYDWEGKIPPAPMPTALPFGAENKRALVEKSMIPVEEDENLKRRQKLENDWTQIVTRLAQDRARNCWQNYKQRKEKENLRMTTELVLNGKVILVPMPREVVHSVYVYSDGSRFGQDLDDALGKAEYCLKQSGNIGKPLSELEAECPVPTKLEMGREELFYKWAQLATKLKDGIPIKYLGKDGEELTTKELLAQLELAFEAFVKGKQLLAFLNVPKIESGRKPFSFKELTPKKAGVVPIVANGERQKQVKDKIAEWVKPKTEQPQAIQKKPKTLTKWQEIFNKKVKPDKESEVELDKKKELAASPSEKRNNIDTFLKKERSANGGNTPTFNGIGNRPEVVKKPIVPASHYGSVW